jgi:hypothetical protein
MLTLIVFNSCINNNQKEVFLNKIDSLNIKNETLIKLLKEKKSTSNYWYKNEFDGEKLLNKGISNPSDFIKNSLRKKTEIIPLAATLGGTMRFGNIQLLSSEWLIAEFDDGHIYGKAIYKYKLNNKGELEFELLTSIGPE